LITKPTRIQQDTASLIDNIFCNQPNCDNLFNGILVTQISDHFPVFTVCKTLNTSKNLEILSKQRNFSQKNLTSFIDAISKIDWLDLVTQNTSRESFSVFHSKLQGIYEACFPLVVQKSVYKSRKPWMTFGIKKSVRMKNKLFVRYKNNPNPQNETIYKNYKLYLRKLLRTAEREYLHSILNDNQHNLRKSWQVMKNLINKNRNQKVQSEFHINDKTEKDKFKISESFNNYFTNIGRNLSNNIPNAPRSPLAYIQNTNVNDSLFYEPTTDYEISKIIQTLNVSSSGFDNLHSKIIKITCQYYIPALTHLVNLSLSEGFFPDELKIAKVIPLFKSGDPMNISNYRPISILPFLSKIYEKVIYNRMIKFIDKHSILYNFQFGFRNNHNTTMALITLIDKIKSASNEGKYTLGVFLDYSKAFDTVNHLILLNKLEKYGIRGIAHQLIRDYLSNRKQYVFYNNVNSHISSINCGVPQGSILGPLLFLLYINDINLVSEKILPILFADDSNIFIHGDNIDEIHTIMNSELNKLLDWVHANKLSLNISKTYYMLFSPNRRKAVTTCKIFIQNSTLTRVGSIKFLGFILDERLSWEFHAKHIRNKIAKGIGIITKARKYLPKPTLLTLYYSFIYPYLMYGIEVWGCMINSYSLPIFKLQKKIVRIITFSSQRAHTNDLFNMMNILNLQKLYIFKLCLFMYNVEHNICSKFIQDLFVKNYRFHNYPTRNLHHYHLPLYRTSDMQRNFRYKGALYWNYIVDEIDSKCSIFTFKKRLKIFLKNTTTNF
jgi:hypothetical protein